jgi:P27 family predicted phage terminase small subunit
MPNPPKPTYLKLLNGNPGKGPINRDEPQPQGELVEPPDHLSPAQKESWRYAIANAPTGLLKLLDQSILETWVVAQELHRYANGQVQQYGQLVKLKSGAWIQNPYLAILNKQALIMMKATAEMGFSPASRTRVHIDPGQTASNPFDDLKRFDGD